MSKKQTFRAKALQGTQLPIFYFAGNQQDLPDMKPVILVEMDADNQELLPPPNPGSTITTPINLKVEDYSQLYLRCYERPPKLIRTQFDFNDNDTDTIDYDADSEDETWLQGQSAHCNIDILTFEKIIDRLEKESTTTVVRLDEAKAMLLKLGGETVITAVYDYWLHKRLQGKNLTLHHNQVRSVFVARPEKRQLRKNRYQDQASYIQMLKLRQNLTKAASLLTLVKQREMLKAKNVTVTTNIFTKRYKMQDYSGATYTGILTDMIRARVQCGRPHFVPNPFHPANFQHRKQLLYRQIRAPEQDELPFKKRKKCREVYNPSDHVARLRIGDGAECNGQLNDLNNNVNNGNDGDEQAEEEEESKSSFEFVPLESCSYRQPLAHINGTWPTVKDDQQFAHCRIDRGGRIVVDRIAKTTDEIWTSFGFTIFDNLSQIHRL